MVRRNAATPSREQAGTPARERLEFGWLVVPFPAAFARPEGLAAGTTVFAAPER